MPVDVVEARYVRGYVVWLKFSDGAAGEIDLVGELDGQVFEPLREIEYFKQFSIVLHTLAWPDGADFAPQFLRDRMAVSV
jgi:hypothetical protein